MQAPLEFNQRDLGHGASETTLTPIVAVALLVAIVLILWRPRKYVAVPLLLCTLLVPRGEQLLLAGAHFYVPFILILTGFIRVVRGRFRIAGGFNDVDRIFIVWALYRVFAATVTNWPGGTMGNLAFLLQAMCGYFLFRYLIRSEEDVVRIAKTLALLAVVLGLGMLYESRVHVNLFATYLAPGQPPPEFRDGIVRARAAFGHPILAGCFGATLIPLFLWLWKAKSRVSAVAGIVGSTLMVLTANSSTPVLAYVAGILGLLLWPVRRSMKAVRWGIVIALMAPVIVMNAPVWFLIAHINVIGGSGGYDRAFLIGTCVQHFKDWWLIGTNQNGGWGYDMWDLSNQFVSEGETGGILTLICFIAIIAKCFGRLEAVRKRVTPKQHWLFWCLGSVMLAHIFAYLGVAYWDQTQIWWFAFLAMICAVTVPRNLPESRKPVLAAAAAVTLPDLEKTAAALP
jgi:hypothetical protein